jgi:hypothetical protein
LPPDFERRRQLLGIVTPERMRVGQLQQGRGNLCEPVILDKILAEQPQGRYRLRDAQSRLAATTSEGGSDFYFRNASQVNEIPGRRCNQGPDPGGPCLLDIAFDDRTGIQEVRK